MRHLQVGSGSPALESFERDFLTKSVSRTASTRFDWSGAHSGLMQLVCQRNSLNLRSFAVQEIAELSEILTVQKTLATCCDREVSSVIRSR
jgi:hypothetical protein